MFEADQGANYGTELAVLANCLKSKFGGPDPRFFYTIPTKDLAPKISSPAGIKGASTRCEISHWLAAKQGDDGSVAAAKTEMIQLIDRIVAETYQ